MSIGSAMDAAVPVVRDNKDVYYPDDLPVERLRLSSLLERFGIIYGGKKPAFIARSPGRVDILGSHVDHQLYDVLPMAIAADILVAVLPRATNHAEPHEVAIANLNEKFKPATFSLPKGKDVEIDASTLQWSNYFKAGLRGAVELLRKKQADFEPCGLDVLVDGSVPFGAGVSSSAAFVCASALAVLRANGQATVSKNDLTELAIVSERAVGVNSGGMDQSASVFAIQGDALRVSFYPKLQVEAIKFPKTSPPITFMIAQSFVTANKHETGPIHYNLRVVECTLAAEYMAAYSKDTLEPDAGALGKSLRGLEIAIFDARPHKEVVEPKKRLEHMLELTRKVLSKPEGYTREDIASVLEISVDDLEKKYMTKFPVNAERFKLRQRALHVYGEALRILDFRDLLLSPPSTDASESSDTLLTRLGKLMNDTQTSCRTLFENSCPEVEKMCEIAREAGAYGSRIAGAGWGGCSVHLVPKDKVERIKKAWFEQYYRQRDPEMTEERLKEVGAVVVSEPGHGSMV